METGEFETAKTFYEKSLAIKEKFLQKNHPEIALTYNGCAFFFSFVPC
jgi:hypothetical protein